MKLCRKAGLFCFSTHFQSQTLSEQKPVKPEPCGSCGGLTYRAPLHLLRCAGPPPLHTGKALSPVFTQLTSKSESRSKAATLTRLAALRLSDFVPLKRGFDHEYRTLNPGLLAHNRKHTIRLCSRCFRKHQVPQVPMRILSQREKQLGALPPFFVPYHKWQTLSEQRAGQAQALRVLRRLDLRAPLHLLRCAPPPPLHTGKTASPISLSTLKHN